MVGRVLNPIYNMAISRMEGLRAYTYPVPDGQDLELDEQRSIISILKEEEEKPLIEIETPVDNMVDGTGNQENGGSGSSARKAAPKITARNQGNPEVAAREAAPKITVKNPEVAAREVAPRIIVRNQEILRELIREHQWPV